ncbi:metallophosphoesterase [Megasphaera massiliensis]|uniref:metallophosphoesterase n=1 Tax=Megasphaera massiliensis TaxID=1232428 RepID=UPI003AB06478
MNTVIVLLHLAVFWGAAALIQWGLQKRRKKPFQGHYACPAAVLVTVLYLAVGFVQANHVWQTDYTVTTAKPVGSLRVALLADSHVGTTFDGEGLAAYMARIQEQKPDVVVIAGDFVDEGTRKEDMIAASRALGQIDVPYGVYYVFGNHDKGRYAKGQRGYDGDDLIAELQKNGVTVLQDQSVLIDDRFYLVGRQDASEEKDFGGGRAAISDLTKNLDKDKYTIVLDHQPSDYEAEAAAGVDLVLSGHTHGGQLIPMGQLMRWFHIGGEDNVYGFEQRGNTNFIVTSGISDWALQFKTGTQSEYVIIDVQGK